jgi:hypothetical protein
MKNRSRIVSMRFTAYTHQGRTATASGNWSALSLRSRCPVGIGAVAVRVQDGDKTRPAVGRLGGEPPNHGVAT